MDGSFRVSAILMASGLSRRMSSDKLLLPYRGQPLISHAMDLIAGLPFHQRILVVTKERLAKISLPPGYTVVVNDHPEDGQSVSLRLGVSAADGDAYMFFTADQPLLDRDAVELLLRRSDGEHIVYPTIDKAPRTPVIFPAGFREELLSLRGDQGGRFVRASHQSACLPLEVRERAFRFADVDTWEEYLALHGNAPR